MAKRKRPRRLRDYDTSEDAKLESTTAGKPLEAKANPRFTSQVNIYVNHYRVTLLDPDNLSTKAVTDAIVHHGILAGDRAKDIKEIRHRQIKVKSEADQKTVVMIRLATQQ
jgi:hypothetical protein